MIIINKKKIHIITCTVGLAVLLSSLGYYYRDYISYKRALYDKDYIKAANQYLKFKDNKLDKEGVVYAADLYKKGGDIKSNIKLLSDNKQLGLDKELQSAVSEHKVSLSKIKTVKIEQKPQKTISKEQIK